VEVGVESEEETDGLRFGDFGVGQWVIGAGPGESGTGCFVSCLLVFSEVDLAGDQ
jgi:hypothetical protein